MLVNFHLEVTQFIEIQFNNLIREHINFLLLKVSKLRIKIHSLLLFNFSGDELPFFFELEAFLVVLDAPLMSTSGLLFGCWFWDLGYKSHLVAKHLHSAGFSPSASALNMATLLGLMRPCMALTFLRIICFCIFIK